MEVSNIPQIEFFKKQELAIEFELMALEDLFSRQDKVVPPLDLQTIFPCSSYGEIAWHAEHI